MDSTTGWILGVCGALIVTVIGLFIEYNYFRKRKHNGEPQKLADGGNLLWKEAINKAVEDFGKNHADSTVEIKKWTVINDKAQVHVYVKKKIKQVAAGRYGLPPRPSRLSLRDYYTLTVDKAGDILEIKNL